MLIFINILSLKIAFRKHLEKVMIPLFQQQSGGQNSERYYLDSIIVGEDHGWHEMKYQAL